MARIHLRCATPEPAAAPVPAEGEGNGWPANRVWIPESAVALMAVSPELENVEGDWWIRAASAPQGDAEIRRKAFDEAIAIVDEKLIGNRGMFNVARDVQDALELARDTPTEKE